MRRYRVQVFNNGHAVDIADHDDYATAEEAQAALSQCLDDCCPPGDRMRQHYRAEVQAYRACICSADTHTPETCNPHCGCPRCWDTWG